MTTKRLLRGYELRCVLTLHLFQNGKTTVAGLIDMLDYHGFEVTGRPSKAVLTGSTSGPWRCERRRRLCGSRRTTHSGMRCSDWNSARTVAEHGVDMSVCAQRRIRPGRMSPPARLREESPCYQCTPPPWRSPAPAMPAA